VFVVRRIVCGWVARENKILLVDRPHQPWKGYYGPPGGGVRKGENLKDAIIREVFEETGLKVKVKRFMGSFVIRHQVGTDVRMYMFECEKVGGKLKARSDVNAVFWTKADAVLKLRVPSFLRDLVTGYDFKDVYEEK